ncbi:hypothetical protein VNO78_20259 [Psophocarpus tetragonolobus]|uniref:Uncharacterized protein n=1 Tax=Psophocarpus tetragonolobus TaxID=3891 RepID=A0AAN9XH17_PSOTE
MRQPNDLRGVSPDNGGLKAEEFATRLEVVGLEVKGKDRDGDGVDDPRRAEGGADGGYYLHGGESKGREGVHVDAEVHHHQHTLENHHVIRAIDLDKLHGQQKLGVDDYGFLHLHIAEHFGDGNPAPHRHVQRIHRQPHGPGGGA